MIDRSGWLLTGLNERAWWRALSALERSLAGSADGDVVAAYSALFRSLASHGHASVAAAVAGELLYGELAVAPAELELEALKTGLEFDLEQLQELAACDWQQRAVQQAGQQLPPLHGLAPETDSELARLAASLATGGVQLHDLLDVYARQGQGQLAQGRAWRLKRGHLVGLPGETNDRLADLYGLEPQLAELTGLVRAWLDGRPRLHLLLYGPRGSGKSTAARSLLSEYAASGLRLLEARPEELTHLPGLLTQLAASPLKFMVFVDDLGFGGGDSGWQELKTLLDGTLQALPDNVMVLATSNRRALVSQRHSDRPDPLDDDASAWDTLDEKLALADRFGLVITFPPADQRRYLGIMGRIASERGLDPAGLREEALLFARRGNGMSGRTARQFVDSLVR